MLASSSALIPSTVMLYKPKNDGSMVKAHKTERKEQRLADTHKYTLSALQMENNHTEAGQGPSQETYRQCLHTQSWAGE